MPRLNQPSRSTLLKEILPLIRSQVDRSVEIRLILALVLITVTSSLTALGPLALKWIVDGLSGRPAPMLALGALIVLYVLSQWLGRTVGELRGLLYARAERRMSRTLAERLFAHVLRLPLRFHLDRQTGAITQSLTNGLQGFQLVLHTLMFSLLPVVTELATVVIVLIRLGQPAFLGLFSGAIACYAIVFTYAARRTMAAARAASAAQVVANGSMTDGILNYEVVKYFAAEEFIEQKIGGALVHSETEWVRFYRQYALNGLLVATIYATFLGTTILYAAHEAQSGRISIGMFVLVNTYMLQIVRPVETLGYAVQSFSQGLAYLDKALELLRQVPESTSLPHGCEARAENETPGGALEFRNVSLSYRPDRSVLRGVSFRVPPGKTLGIVGSSGSGKSTIVRLIMRLLEPDDGQVLLDGAPIHSLPLAHLRGSIAVVPQDTVLFNDTLGYNIALGKPGSATAKIEEAARRAHLHDFIMALPDRYDTQVGERGVKLSGGERQRVSIARAAIKEPRIYIFDEATSSLDTTTEREVLHNLQEISQNSTTIVIAHRLSTVIHADEIVVLEHGAIVEQGTHTDLLEREGRYATLWAAQMRHYQSPSLADA